MDHGASYFTVRDADFTEAVNSLIDRGIVRPWTDTFHVYSEGAMYGVLRPLFCCDGVALPVCTWIDNLFCWSEGASPGARR